MMEGTKLLSLPDGMRIEQIQITENGLVIEVIATHPTSRCPLCSEASSSIHCHYRRVLRDAPCAGRQVQLVLSLHKFSCRNPYCSRKVFAERFPDFVEPWARTTIRHCQQITCAGYLGHLFWKLVYWCDRTNLLAEAWEMRVQSTRFMLLVTRLPTRLFHEGEVQFVLCIFISMKQQVCFRFHAFQERVLRWIKPPATSLLLGTLSDLTRKKSELIAENALLRQQLIILRRQVERPVCGKTDRLLLVLLARVVRSWKQALFLVQPETLLRWHRELFGMFWKRKSKVHTRKPRLSPETISLIKEMAANNRLWGAERIRGELLKLDIRVSKRTIQKYMKQVRPKQARGQTWKTFLRNHAAEVWACDFLHIPDLFFRPLFAFFIIELKSRKVIHVNVTRTPTDPWVAQQLREATPYGQTPKYLIRDNDKKFGRIFARVAATSGIKVLRTPYRTPQANAVCERFLGSVRRECLDHFLILHEKQLHRLLQAYVVYFNQARPHQGLGQRIPEPLALSASPSSQPHQVLSIPVLGGLHHDYQRAA